MQDNLRSMGKFNPETKKTKTPDGRDLNELTKEELIRLIESTLKNAPTGDPAHKVLNSQASGKRK